jgi:SNF2-related domain
LAIIIFSSTAVCVQVAIHDCDVCLITWEQIMKELREHHAKSVLAKWGFWRIIIDEAQSLEINYGEDGDMLNDLWRRKMWLLSGMNKHRQFERHGAAKALTGCCMPVAGTPVQKMYTEWQQYLKILTCEPFYHNMTWKALCSRPWLCQEPMGLNTAKCESIFTGCMIASMCPVCLSLAQLVMLAFGPGCSPPARRAGRC